MLGVCFTLIDDENDKDKFEELYLKYRQRAYAIAYSILRNSHDAEDAVGQAFLSVANNFKKVSLFSRQEFEAYIVIIIRNTSINIFNQNKKDLNEIRRWTIIYPKAVIFLKNMNIRELSRRFPDCLKVIKMFL